MAVLVSRAQRSYTPQTVSLPFSVPSAASYIVCTVTRVSWPAGVVAIGKIEWSDGSNGIATFIGDGSTPAKIGAEKRAGVTGGTVTVEVVQGCTSAITVENL